jgi:hypothetical protein
MGAALARLPGVGPIRELFVVRAVLTAIFAIGAALVAGSAVAATPPPRVCPDGMKPATTAELFFGRNVGWTGQVSDADWRSFLDAEVTPRFPDGLAVSDVYGQLRSPAGAFVRQNDKALFIVLAGLPDEQQRLGLVRDAYKKRFHQQSVLMVEQHACVSF